MHLNPCSQSSPKHPVRKLNHLSPTSVLLRYVTLLMLTLGIVSMPGCSGCRTDSDERLADKIKRENERLKEKKPKPNFRSPGTMILPGKYPELERKTGEEIDEMRPEEKAAYLNNQFTRVNRTKTGHWLETVTPTIANNFNQEGQIRSIPMQGTFPAVIPGTAYELATARSFSLVKDQWKYLRSTVYVPSLDSALKSSINLSVDFTTDRGGLPFYTVPLTLSQTMAGFQYHMVVLSNRQEQIRYLQFTDSIRIRQPEFSTVDTPPFYYVVTHQPDRPIPLPRNVLNWTTTAYLIWDDIDADQLDSDQQQSLIDWLHFGGQLILSGPDCLGKLESSFLADYLPAQSDGKKPIDAAAVESLNEHWSVPSRINSAQRRSILVTDKNPMVGVEFKPHTDARFIQGTGELTIERSIGRGRVVATAFSLTSPSVKSWGSFPSFFNNALLRKPRRNFRSDNDTIGFNWIDDATSMFDPLVNSSVRFISRDLADLGTPENPEPEIAATDYAQSLANADLMWGAEIVSIKPDRPLERNLEDTRRYGGFKSDEFSGVGGWSDDSAIARSARAGLKTAAGISPPSAELILTMLGVYLLVLVPANWLLFRAIGKVEWAWAAVPVIAIAGAITVVKIASLDIGFARSNTQVALLEIHDGYHRGHLSQYSALYTSLSTNYAIELDNATGIAMPLGGTINEDRERLLKRQRLTLQQSLTNRTDNFQIQSNSTELLHAQWIQDIGGRLTLKRNADPIDFGRLKIQNTSNLRLTSAGVIARDAEGQYYAGWVGDLPKDAKNDGPNANATLDVLLDRCDKFDLEQLWTRNSGLINPFSSPQQLISNFTFDDRNRIPLKQILDWPLLERFWPAFESIAQESIAQGVDDASQRSVSRVEFLTTINEAKLSDTDSLAGQLLLVVLKNLELGKGEIRLLGVTDEPIGETRFDPQSTQTTGQTLVVAHLRHAPLEAAARDANSMLDFARPSATLTDAEKEENQKGSLSDEVFDGTLQFE